MLFQRLSRVFSFTLISFSFILGVFPMQSIEAQILNIEKSLIREDEENHFFTDFSFAVRANNRSAGANDPVQLFSVNGNADLAYYTPKHSFMLLNFMDYLGINDNTFLSFGYSHFRVNLLRNQFFSYEVFSQGQYDFQRGLDQRFLGGGGIRLRLIESEKLSITAGIGAMWEHERWQEPYEEALVREINMPKTSNYLRIRWQLNEQISFNTIGYYQYGLDPVFQRQRHRISNDTNLNIKLSQRLSFRCALNFAYESDPIVPITPLIYSLSNGIRFNFYK
ncbi:DUF481 domain-containing protein [Eisenibacter elegans]|jgi:hypothetical protein|uniref:DUF481 domain-containing protein n=1 Tax=Eisenibacter elegans TaxID=997 RepID=UPI00040FD094|nr:DUF481 domain-containing protein [Eisenibacter elegans]